ncbi:glycosyltransferase family 2 protein [Aestuariivivens sp. NBU2969]|uniref:glycosyltransferase family 2 protein n=1 Tax=Aestuariivivens sp. NBU2969 TaxID=2873267 RepID=UPI001CBBA98E|nr:glycosyltransferase family 2 protein [Aestuariivivens sp. NBU2969]
MPPKVSIIIPVYNRLQLIKQALDSVLAQTYGLWECIVVDDGSMDGTINILESYIDLDNRIKYFERNKLPKGAPTCRNIGLRHACGEYVMFLDSDDYLMPHCLERRLLLFDQNLDKDFLVFPLGLKKIGYIEKIKLPVSSSYLIDFLKFNLPWSIMNPIWKVEFIQQLGGFTEGYPRFNDPELMIRALLEPNVKFKVFNDADYDTVYVPSKNDPKVFKDKVYQSLLFFIPDISRHLDVNGKKPYKKHLANYLKLWFKEIYIPLQSSKIKESLVLIRLFYKFGIISFWKQILLIKNLMGYSFGNFILQYFKIKLRDKTFYNS